MDSAHSFAKLRLLSFGFVIATAIVASAPAFATQPLFNSPSLSSSFNANGLRTVIAADPNEDGLPDLVVAAGTLQILQGMGDGRFTPTGSYPYHGSPVVADLDLDGHVDILIATYSELIVLLGAGDGSFPRDRRTPQPPFTQVPYVLDVNHDSIPDIVMAPERDRPAYAAVLVGVGDGTFGAPTQFGPYNSQSMACADFDGDGMTDLATISGSKFSGHMLQVIHGASWAESTAWSGGQYQHYMDLVAADIDRDGDLDLMALATAPWIDTDWQLETFENDGLGGFTRNPIVQQRALNYRVYAAADRMQLPMVAVGDFNSDGQIDVSSLVHAYYSGESGFMAGNYLPPMKEGVIVAADFNRDGFDDIAGLDRDGVIATSLGSADGIGGIYSTVTSQLGGPLLTACDWNGDGFDDIATCSSGASDADTLSLGFAGTDGRFSAWTRAWISPEWKAIDIALDRMDLLLLTQSRCGSCSGPRGRLLRFPHMGSGAFGPPQILSLERMPLAFATGHWNADGLLDVAIAHASGLDVYQGTASGEFTPAATCSLEQAPIAIALGDVNADGATDITVASSAAIALLTSNGSSQLQATVLRSLSGGLVDVHARNVDGEVGDEVVVWLSGSQDHVEVLAHDSGSLRLLCSVDVAPAVYLFRVPYVRPRLLLDDFDGDGAVDLIAAASRFTSMYLGIGDGTFANRVDYGTYGAASLAKGDFDGDGDSDLAYWGVDLRYRPDWPDAIGTLIHRGTGIPTATLVDVRQARVEGRFVHIEWVGGNPADRATLERRNGKEAWTSIGAPSRTTDGWNFEETVPSEGRYQYRLSLTTARGEWISEPITLDVLPNPTMSVFPNPSFGRFEIRLAVATPSRVRLRIFDLQGRCVWQETTSFATTHARWPVDTRLRPGIYSLQLDGDGNILGRGQILVLR